MVSMYYCYVIENKIGELYFGSTKDLKRRLKEHQSGKSFATKGHDWTLIYYEAYRSEDDARTREQNIKRNGGTKKHLKNRVENSRLSPWQGKVDIKFISYKIWHIVYE